MTFVSSTSISLSWSAPDENSRNGIIRGYNVTLEDDFFRVRNVFVRREQVTINDLEPFTRYTVKVAAHTVATGPFSSAQPVTTLVDSKSCDVANIYVLTLFWDKIYSCYC